MPRFKWLARAKAVARATPRFCGLDEACERSAGACAAAAETTRPAIATKEQERATKRDKGRFTASLQILRVKNPAPTIPRAALLVPAGARAVVQFPDCRRSGRNSNNILGRPLHIAFGLLSIAIRHRQPHKRSRIPKTSLARTICHRAAHSTPETSAEGQAEGAADSACILVNRS
jgi:hypothetical protein